MKVLINMNATDLIENDALGFSAVEGWMRPQVCSYLDMLIGVMNDTGHDFGDSLEIGVHHGRLFLALERITPVEHTAYAVDLFSEQHFNVDRSGKGDREIFEQNVANIAVAPDRVKPVQLDSFFLPRSTEVSHNYSIISIDGGHTVQHTAADLTYAESCLRPGGIIILDDFSNEAWLGVMEGAIRFLSEPNRRVAPIIAGHNKLILTTFSHHNDYVKRIQKAAVNYRKISPKRYTHLCGHICLPFK